MQDVAGGGAADRPDDRDDVYGAVVADLVSLIERVQASLTMIESAVAAQASTALQELAANVVVLDDVTPRYLKAGAALRAATPGSASPCIFSASRPDPRPTYQVPPAAITPAVRPSTERPPKLQSPAPRQMAGLAQLKPASCLRSRRGRPAAACRSCL
jgi:hypothetical protein